MAKHIWIFEPAPGWEYVGGVAIAVADTYGRAVELLKTRSDQETTACFWRKVTDVPGLLAEAYDTEKGFYPVPVDDPKASTFHYAGGTMASSDNWTLSADYELAMEVEERTILNYNYA